MTDTANKASMSHSQITGLSVEILNGKLAGRIFTAVNGTPIGIGREPSNEIALDERGVSRRHCRLVFDSGCWFLEDLGSTNGVHLQKLDSTVEIKSNRHRVENNDEYGIGEARIRVELLKPEEATEVLPPLCDTVDTELLQNSSSNPHAVTVATSEVANENLDDASNLFSNHLVVAHPGNPVRTVFPFQFRDLRILKKIGQGGMGEVFLAERNSRENKKASLAIKFLREQKELSEMDRARFMREMEISTRLGHSSIVECLECGQEESRLFIVMPYCTGGNLADLLKRTRAIGLRRALKLLDRLLAGVEFAHKLGIVHRDLKPQNILLAKNRAGKYLPKISDFGLAKSYLLAGSSGMTTEGTVGGSWAYMPKEQLTNFRFVSPQSDVWSLGAILYECLTLRLPRPLQPNADPIRTILENKIIPIDELIADIPPRIESFIMKSLAVELADRYKDASQMRAALHTAAEHAGIEL